LKSQQNKSDNMGLWLDKLVGWTDQDERGRDADLQPMMAAKKRQVPMLKRGRDGVLEMQLAKPLVEACQARLQQQRSIYERQGYCIHHFEASPDYRLVVGFGAEHVLETNLALHRIYGFPIIPGSAIKGVARAAAFWEIAASLSVSAPSVDEEKRRIEAKKPTPLQLLDRLLSQGEDKGQEDALARLKDDLLCRENDAIQSLDAASWRELAGSFYRAFGTTSRRGQVIFFDAYPTEAPKLELDILNPHYGDYYQEKKDSQNKPIAPADYLNPNPNYFLTVGRGSRFAFALASKDATLSAKAKEWLTRGLTEIGIGGKTSAGYGFMEVRQ
jgi:CRISPR-associated protein Cmr6